MPKPADQESITYALNLQVDRGVVVEFGAPTATGVGPGAKWVVIVNEGSGRTRRYEFSNREALAFLAGAVSAEHHVTDAIRSQVHRGAAKVDGQAGVISIPTGVRAVRGYDESWYASGRLGVSDIIVWRKLKLPIHADQARADEEVRVQYPRDAVSS